VIQLTSELNHLLKMSVNPIWNFFEKLECDKSRALCKACGNTYSLGSDKPKRQSVTGLKNHLRSHHKDINNLFIKRRAEMEVHNTVKRVKQECAEVECPEMFELPNFMESAETALRFLPSCAESESELQNGDFTGYHFVVSIFVVVAFG